uniref:Box C/D snoRNA protein 1 n=1 Tax=Lygus hesperus TaxID=30085 RepID=A0A146MHR1_LYGHE
MADDDIQTTHSTRNRLGDCEVCARAPAKYTCPECEVKSCSLPCVKIHKSELECDGVRSRVKFRRLHKLSNLDILSDYRLLEETNRAVDSAKKTNVKLLNMNGKYFHNRKKAQSMITGARKKEVGLKLLPPNFTDHKNNSTYFNHKNNEFLWKIKLKFLQAEDFEVVEHRVPDGLILGDLVAKYFDPAKFDDSKLKGKLAPYHNREIHRVEILLPAEGVPGKKFFLMNPKETIADNLKYKNIIEHPTFHVILDENLPNYNIVHIVTKNKNLLELNDEDSEDEEKMC